MTCFEQPLHFNLEVFGGINQISKAGQEICGLGETERVSNWKDAFQDKGYWVRTFVPRYSHCSSYLSNSCTRDLSLRSACPHRQKNLINMFPVCVIYIYMSNICQLSQEGFWKMFLIIGEIVILIYCIFDKVESVRVPLGVYIVWTANAISKGGVLMWPVGCPLLPVVGHQGRVWFGFGWCLGKV